MTLDEAFRKYKETPGDETLGVLYPLVRERVKRELRWRTGSEPEEDLIGTTTHDILLTVDSFDLDGPARFSSWVVRIARQHGVYEARQRLKRPFQLYDPSAAEFGEGVAFQGDQINSLILADIFQQLDDDETKLLSGKMEGLDGAELAEILEVPEGTIKSRWFQLRKKLMNHLGVSSMQQVESETPSTSLQVL